MSDVVKLVPKAAPAPETPWTPEDLVVAFLADLRAGKIKPTCLMVFFMEDTPDGRMRPQTWSANVSRAEAIAFCELEKQRTIEDWKQ